MYGFAYLAPEIEGQCYWTGVEEVNLPSVRKSVMNFIEQPAKGQAIF
jgi:hypothetical protein